MKSSMAARPQDMGIPLKKNTEPPQTHATGPNRDAVPAYSPGVDAKRPRLGNQMHHRRRFPAADSIGVPSPTGWGARMAKPARRIGGAAASQRRVTFGTRTLPQNPVSTVLRAGASLCSPGRWCSPRNLLAPTCGGASVGNSAGSRGRVPYSSGLRVLAGAWSSGAR